MGRNHRPLSEMDIAQPGNRRSGLRKRSNRDDDLRYIHTNHLCRDKTRLVQQTLFLCRKDAECKRPVVIIRQTVPKL